MTRPMNLPPPIRTLDKQLLRILVLAFFPQNPCEVVTGNEEIGEDGIGPAGDVLHEVSAHHGFEVQLCFV